MPLCLRLSLRGACRAWSLCLTMIAAAIVGPSALAQETVTFNLKVTEGPMRHAASGFLHPFKGNEPPMALQSELCTPLGIKFLRTQADWLPSYHQREPKALLVGVLSDGWGYPSRGKKGTPPWEDWSRWEQYVTKQVESLKKQNLHPVYDPWNEPNESQFFVGWLGQDGKKGWTEEAQDKYFELYKRTYALIRRLDPQAEITGSSEGRSTPGAREGFRRFKQFCVANDCVPTYWNWHFSDDETIKDVAEGLQGNLNKGVLITEYLGPDASMRPGRAAYEIDILECSGATGAMKAIWSKKEQPYGSINGLVFQDESGAWKKRGVWWSYATYAAMTGDRLRASSTDPRLRGLAAYDTAKKQIRGLLGNARKEPTDQYKKGKNSGYRGQMIVVLQNLQPLGDELRVVVERIPYRDYKEVDAPEPVIDEQMTAENGRLYFSLDYSAGEDAYRFTVTPAEGT